MSPEKKAPSNVFMYVFIVKFENIQIQVNEKFRISEIVNIYEDQIER